MPRCGTRTGTVKPCKGGCGAEVYNWPKKVPPNLFCGRTCYDRWRASDGCMLERFWQNVEKSEACWNYKTLNVEGYGIIAVGSGPRRKQYLAHRYAWKVYHGTLPPADMAICHHCDNPRCVRPEHLYVGTWKDNAEDRTRRDRHVRGERSWSAKLTDDQVREIRLSFKRTGPKQSNTSQLARQYGVSPCTIGFVVSGRGWRHLQAESSSPNAALGDSNQGERK